MRAVKLRSDITKTGNSAQMEFVFGPQYSDIALKEAVRGVKAITKEVIRFGGDGDTASRILQILAEDNAIVYAAANAIEEALPD